MQDAVYFISDAHLGAGVLVQEQDKRERLLSFLRYLHGRASLLYIVGDLFDFWFEYRSAILKQHFSVLYELNDLVKHGTRVVYIAGNHDFYLGPFLREQVGLETVSGPLIVEHQGKRLFICHGDGMIGKDWGYRLARKVLHNQVCVRLFQYLHPDVGVVLGRLVSRLSRRHGAPGQWDPRQAYRDLAWSMLHDNGYDAVVFGHVHTPDVHEQDGKVYLNLGDWIHHFTYGLLSDGALRLMRFEETP